MRGDERRLPPPPTLPRWGARGCGRYALQCNATLAMHDKRAAIPPPGHPAAAVHAHERPEGVHFSRRQDPGTGRRTTGQRPAAGAGSGAGPVEDARPGGADHPGRPRRTPGLRGVSSVAPAPAGLFPAERLPHPAPAGRREPIFAAVAAAPAGPGSCVAMIAMQLSPSHGNLARPNDARPVMWPRRNTPCPGGRRGCWSRQRVSGPPRPTVAAATTAPGVDCIALQR